MIQTEQNILQKSVFNWSVVSVLAPGCYVCLNMVPYIVLHFNMVCKKQEIPGNISLPKKQ